MHHSTPGKTADFVSASCGSTAAARPRSILWASVLCASVSLAACGGGGGEAGSGATPSPAAAPSASDVTIIASPSAQPVLSTDISTPATPAGVPMQTQVADPVYATPLAAEIFRATNLVRLAAGIGLLRQEPSMDTAAAAHTRYMVLNNSGGHGETSGQPGFTGVSHTERLAAAGYSGVVWENVSGGGTKTGGQIVLELYMSTPYHRTPFLVFESTSMGIGVEQPISSMSINTLLFGYKVGAAQGYGSNKIVVWPYSGMKEVPRDGCCEVPNPFQGARGLWGYPVSLHAPQKSVLNVTSFTLTDVIGTKVAATLLTSQNDPNKLLPAFTTHLIPDNPLGRGMTYIATASGTIDGTPFNQTWSFTTKLN